MEDSKIGEVVKNRLFCAIQEHRFYPVENRIKTLNNSILF